MIKPTIGRQVWYHPDNTTDRAMSAQGQPLAATVVYVWNDRLVNLAVFDGNGQHFQRKSVVLIQDDDAFPIEAAYCEWMPYQRQVAATTPPAV
jgi:hypothetical protein